MKLSIDISGIPELKTELGDDVKDIVRRITFGVESRSKVLIQTSPASGNIYPRGKSGSHQASAPGEPPATDTGFLVNSIQAELHSDDTIGTIEFGAEYALPLEGGTEHMAPRPFVVPAIEYTLEHL